MAHPFSPTPTFFCGFPIVGQEDVWLPLKESFHGIFKISRQIPLGLGILNVQVSCEMTLYVGYTTYFSVCVFRQAFGRVWPYFNDKSLLVETLDRRLLVDVGVFY